jgi:hypothetical protein
MATSLTNENGLVVRTAQSLHRPGRNIRINESRNLLEVERFFGIGSGHNAVALDFIEDIIYTE